MSPAPPAIPSSMSGERRRTDSPGLNSMGIAAADSTAAWLNTSRFRLAPSSEGFRASSRTGSGSTAVAAGCTPGPPCLAMIMEILWAMSFTVRTLIKSSSSIVIPNWRSAASMMMGRRLDRMERSFLRSMSGWISSRLNPVASMMIRISLSMRSWSSDASPGAGAACCKMAGVESRGGDAGFPGETCFWPSGGPEPASMDWITDDRSPSWNVGSSSLRMASSMLGFRERPKVSIMNRLISLWMILSTGLEPASPRSEVS